MKSLLKQAKKALLIILIPVPRVLYKSGTKNSPFKKILLHYILKYGMTSSSDKPKEDTMIQNV